MPVLKVFALFAFSALAAQARPVSQAMKLIDNKRTVIEILDKEEIGQAAAFVDASRNDEFIELLRQTPGTTLGKIAADIEKENDCGEGEEVRACGEVVVQGKVLSSFGRGGWSSAGAAYRYFIGWRQAGTGHFFEAKYTFEIQEDVAVRDDDLDPEARTKVFVKTLLFSGARDISKDALDIP